MSKEDKDAFDEEMKTQSIIQGGDFDLEAEKKKYYGGAKQYTYGAMTFNMKDVRGMNALDEEHTTIRFYGGDAYVFKIGYPDFGKVYQMMMGVSILNFCSSHETVNQEENGQQVDNS